MRVAVVGAGISGLVSAYVLAKGGAGVVVYEKEDYVGGHAKTVTMDGVDLDLGFMVFNRVTYPNMMEFFESLGVDMEISDMSFSVSLDNGHGCEWGSRNGFSGLFAQKKNLLNPYFWQMIREILNYLEEFDNNPDMERNDTLGEFIKSRGYSELFQKAYIIPMCASIWSCSSEGVMAFSAYSILSFCRNHHLLQLFGRPQWLTVKQRSHRYVNKVREELEKRGCEIRCGSEVHSVSTDEQGGVVIISGKNMCQETYDGCIMAAHAPDTLKMLGKQATFDELRILAAWSAWNFLGTVNSRVCLTYWLNTLQNLGETGQPYLVTLNPPRTPEQCLLKWTTGHPVPSVAASKASSELKHIQGKRRIWFCGAYQVYWKKEARFSPLKEQTRKTCSKFWLEFIVLSFTGRGWWTPLLFTSAIASAKYFIRHVSRQNTLTQARRNISRHYDLSNELFSLFLDETMTYSCAVFKSEDEDLKTAQMRKISLLIDKAKISKEHHILEIGCGWGSLAIEAVKRTGCKYTGITLSEQQLKYAEAKVREAGLQDNIRFLLCDYRQLPDNSRYDRIISCEMLEAVGHEFMNEFFGRCESVLAENGILVLQFISIPDERYDEYRQSSDFIKEYIFPGGCLPSLSRVTSAMAASSRLCVEHLEDIGIHYYQTLRCWRENFMERQSQILDLGFDNKFIRTWEYYFDYCAAGFQTCTLGNYQIVFSRPGNVSAFGDPYKEGLASA
nr:Mycolic acid cyclopropane synthase [Ipomoea trifida]